MLLALDTSSPQVSVALHDGVDVVDERVSEQPMRHGEQVMPLVDAALRACDAHRHDLTAVAVGVGPGPFTGLRVGLVTARTLAHVLDLPVYGVCSLDVLALEAVAQRLPGLDAGFAAASDARRREVHLATYDAEGRRVDGPVVGRADALAATLPPGLPVVGEGALLYPDALRAAGEPMPLRPSAGWLARAVAGELVELGDPEPLYLRRPDAETPGARKPVS
ncbi:tRNA (adenosine(37)-N6)-threonylcarbamoyltransferase complex dimerization subunit type 1 TsaB [Nocardioides sp. TRM66260-LWL]|uniref:tRNA (adenosine(37)-N6)-threonylcarbamoyltransferase complex dimerization subunit type 1 TsaB n=1 Tax=Nocardioides sp. TRM66260-LWL TaxID=2874478 RepID=UPI001CC571C9|nr:tRNA (adenosine(37)-N6)-threonylcarbamoyltransferase complex dimerization subunit type 1 TsaB [Nocardioides sp. TRM66260-LWL]MBZ5733190.1 tRNA (adenosine(37)-N6)-threonylcarbamoyltransferase complex dimerization subunit type 1 TsaB [Nocardioides sp. TRM66260-LWL]